MAEVVTQKVSWDREEFVTLAILTESLTKEAYGEAALLVHIELSNVDGSAGAPDALRHGK